MKSVLHTSTKSLILLAVLTALTALPQAARADQGQLIPAKSVDAAWLVKARANYPLDTCTISGNKLEDGQMGKPPEYVYREAGKPDRLVRFCCGGCIKTFKKDPAASLKIIDDAAAAQAPAARK